MHVSRLLRGALDTLRRAADAAAEPERPDPAP
jgi:hypothetical protein